jgi:hypothetical protein
VALVDMSDTQPVFYEDEDCIIYQPEFDGTDWKATALDKTYEYKGQEWELIIPDGNPDVMPSAQEFLDVLDFHQTWSSTAWDDADWAAEDDQWPEDVD